jgi:hypothetical protein
MYRFLLIFTAMLFTQISLAQITDSTEDEVIDYSNFGDAGGVKRYATQKTINQTPNRIVSIGYEYQSAFDMPNVPAYPNNSIRQTFNAQRLSGIRAQVNVPIVSNTKIIWQMGANYWMSGVNFKAPPTNDFITALGTYGMQSAGINTTVFKPLNEKNFIIFQASADINGVFKRFNDINSKALTISGTAIYGWKPSDKNMYGFGVARTYRAGQIIHVPVVLWNKTFNDHWGMELLLPARAHLRYNFSTSNILQMGYELEGNQFWMRTLSPNGEVFIQRGEFKPRIMWDKKIAGFIWLNVQAGLRYNWRFDVMNQYNARKEDQLFFNSKLSNPMYFNISLNLVSP